MVKAVIQICGLVIAPKFGKLNCPKNEAASLGIGTLTKWSADIANVADSFEKR